MHRGNRSATFRPDIEGLRAIAILLVVLYHCGVPALSGGFVGVDVFFVLSGYLITGMLANEAQNTSRISLLRFYARRARRLLPAAALSMFVTLLIGMAILAPSEITLAGEAGGATALYVSNIFFAMNVGDYFAPTVAGNPLLHTWSLAVEEQFYLFWPLVIMVGLQFVRSPKALLSTLIGLTVLSFAASIWVTANHAVFAFYGLPTRIWEFGFAAVMAVNPPGVLKRIRASACIALGWLGFCGIIASAHFITSNVGFPGWIAIIPVLSTIAVLISSKEQPADGVTVLLNTGPLQLLGRLSYSWYLWHWPFLVLAVAIFPAMPTTGKLIVANFALAVAAITHYWIENPIRFHPYLLKRPILTLSLAGGITLCSLGAAMLSVRMGGWLENEPGMKALSAARLNRFTASATCGLRGEMNACDFGVASPVRIVLFGDSHASQWVNPLRQIALSRGWLLTVFAKPGCAAMDVARPDVSIAGQADCSEWRANAIREIAGLHPKITILGNATYFVKDRPSGANTVSVKEWSEGTRRTLQMLTSAGIHVVALRDTPHFAFDVPTCLARSLRNSWYPANSCAMDETESLNAAVFEAEQAVARGFQNVTLLDLSGAFCKEKLCPATRNGMVVYSDDNHITGQFAESLAPIFESELSSILKAF